MIIGELGTVPDLMPGSHTAPTREWGSFQRPNSFIMVSQLFHRLVLQTGEPPNFE